MNCKNISSYIIKLEGNCNLNCKYCYYFSNEVRHRRNRMSLETIGNILNDVSNRSSIVELIWHGGEPLLAGIKKFNKILDIQDKILLKKNIIFKNLIQTNGTLINKEWLSVFHRGNFSVSISIDGPQFVNDKYRLYQSGNSSYSDTIRGIRLLQNNDINFSVLSVLTKDSIEYAEEIYNFW